MNLSIVKWYYFHLRDRMPLCLLGNIQNDSQDSERSHLYHWVPERVHDVDREGVGVHCTVLKRRERQQNMQSKTPH